MNIIYRIYNKTKKKYVQSASDYSINYSRQGYYWKDRSSALANFMFAKNRDPKSEFIFKEDRLIIENVNSYDDEYDRLFDIVNNIKKNHKKHNHYYLFIDLLHYEYILNQYDYILTMPSLYQPQMLDDIEEYMGDNILRFGNNIHILVKDNLNILPIKLMHTDIVITSLENFNK